LGGHGSLASLGTLGGGSGLLGSLGGCLGSRGSLLGGGRGLHGGSLLHCFSSGLSATSSFRLHHTTGGHFIYIDNKKK